MIPPSNLLRILNRRKILTMNAQTINSEQIFITVEKFFREGKVKRILFRSEEGNYFMDFSVHSFFERTFFGFAVSVVKALSIIIPTIHVVVNKNLV